MKTKDGHCFKCNIDLYDGDKHRVAANLNNKGYQLYCGACYKKLKRRKN